MNNTDRILALYRQADFSERVLLFIQYRDLRESFLDIDLDNPAALEEWSFFDNLKLL
jgi:hypothetical protein